MKKNVLNIKTRVIAEGNVINTEYLIDKKILNLPQNKGRGIEEGWTSLSSEEDCNGKKKPPVLEGQYGEWLCNGTDWVWVPLT